MYELSQIVVLFQRIEWAQHHVIQGVNKPRGQPLQNYNQCNVYDHIKLMLSSVRC